MGSFYNVWSSFIAAVRYCLEKDDKMYKVIRDLFKDALAQVADYPDQARQDYIQFERECGTLDSWCQAKREMSKVVKAEEQTEAAADSQAMEVEEPRRESRAAAKKREIP